VTSTIQKALNRSTPDNLAENFGADARLLRVTVETTHDTVTKGIEGRLKWLKGMDGMLDGRRYHIGKDLANTLTGSDFSWGP